MSRYQDHNKRTNDRYSSTHGFYSYGTPVSSFNQIYVEPDYEHEDRERRNMERPRSRVSLHESPERSRSRSSNRSRNYRNYDNESNGTSRSDYDNEYRRRAEDDRVRLHNSRPSSPRSPYSEGHHGGRTTRKSQNYDTRYEADDQVNQRENYESHGRVNVDNHVEIIEPKPSDHQASAVVTTQNGTFPVGTVANPVPRPIEQQRPMVVRTQDGAFPTETVVTPVTRQPDQQGTMLVNTQNGTFPFETKLGCTVIPAEATPYRYIAVDDPHMTNTYRILRIVGVILSLIGLLCFGPLTFWCSIPALIISSFRHRHADRLNYIMAIVLAAIAIIVGIAALVILIVLVIVPVVDAAKKGETWNPFLEEDD